MPVANALQYVLFLVVVTALVPPAGAYMWRVFEGTHTWLDPVLRPVERGIYRLTGVDPADQMDWRTYALTDGVKSRADAYRAENGLADATPLPADAVTQSASGPDPDISPANALLQVHRVAGARGVSEDRVRALVNQYTQGRTLGVLSEPHVNVLELNRALDAAATP